MSRSAIQGTGHGDAHAWVYYGSGKGYSRYSCECGANFVHRYDEIPDIFKAMKEYGVPIVCGLMTPEEISEEAQQQLDEELEIAVGVGGPMAPSQRRVSEPEPSLDVVNPWRREPPDEVGAWAIRYDGAFTNTVSYVEVVAIINGRPYVRSDSEALKRGPHLDLLDTRRTDAWWAGPIWTWGKR